MVKLTQLFISVTLIGAILVTASPLPQPNPAINRDSMKLLKKTALAGTTKLGDKLKVAAKSFGSQAAATAKDLGHKASAAVQNLRAFEGF
ncbi:hypothetical protein H4R33_000688 [Dimargaris cristalligena]|uniref:Uncharacterized protein n=1 Tax=Dimargaris cristalligena TaxID=215637 RepID=A0A4Q0A2F0_9FUNG|nr:hypothetical protein H4R33_000688 [Dimargaris cristalligena]RKP40306.1 hypothetical protein BJ085DRAFT_37564 [Dimargaris cristalligena]|eukprot:RKP40306.1 hypothetical protein BJ085DRAFT_37564 [Dimargaris cristalligena]